VQRRLSIVENVGALFEKSDEEQQCSQAVLASSLHELQAGIFSRLQRRQRIIENGLMSPSRVSQSVWLLRADGSKADQRLPRVAREVAAVRTQIGPASLAGASRHCLTSRFFFFKANCISRVLLPSELGEAGRQATCVVRV
jgi:hypothetical protein